MQSYSEIIHKSCYYIINIIVLVITIVVVIIVMLITYIYIYILYNGILLLSTLGGHGYVFIYLIRH